MQRPNNRGAGDGNDNDEDDGDDHNEYEDEDDDDDDNEYEDDDSQVGLLLGTTCRPGMQSSGQCSPASSELAMIMI